MKSFKNVIGKILFWVIWPGLWFYLPLTRRVRVVLVAGDDVLLVRHWLGTQKWELPGGGVSFGESVEDAAKREIEEELGLQIKDIQLLHEGVVIRTEAGIMKRHQYVLAHIGPEDGAITPNREILDVQRHPLSSIERMVPPAVHRTILQGK